MIEDVWVGDADLQTEISGETWLLKYYVRIIEGDNETARPPVYGVKIEKFGQDARLMEKEATPGITAVYEQALSLARRFIDGRVTPMSLLTLADEWIV